MADSVAEMVGFEVATLSVVLGSELVTLAYTGPERFRDRAYSVEPVTILEPVLARAEKWGRFHFLAAEDRSPHAEGAWITTAPEAIDHPDAWQPKDVLIGLLRDDEGRLVGALSVDTPVSRLRPGAPQRRLLERYAAQAERAVLTAFEREELVQQVAHAETARRLIRSASMSAPASTADLLELVHEPLVDGFRASGSWIQVLEPDAVGPGLARARSGTGAAIDDRAVEVAARLAPLLWKQQRVLAIGSTGDLPQPAPWPADLVLDDAQRQLADMGLGSVLAVPLGAGIQCFGFLALSRRPQDPPWAPVELESALQIGHDLGAALMTTRALQRERSVVSELEQLDAYRTHLITTLSHEMRTPLTVISANLEMLGDLDLLPSATRYRDAIVRGTGRLQKVVDDLMLLARVSHPQHPLVRSPVDLREVIHDLIALVESTARAKGLSLGIDLDASGLTVLGHAAEIDRLVGNLVSNAVKFTPAGGTVTVSATRREGVVVLTVADDGLGISAADQTGLFRSFFRTTNPDALRAPGAGLGLSIVAHIAQRHDATVEVTSAPGKGSTFTVTLPAG